MKTKTVLIIDDEIENRKLLKIILKKLDINLNILEAENASQALDILKTIPVSLVLLDILLPDMNGVQILKSIKKDVTVIIVTALEKDELELEGRYIFVQKPINVQNLIKILKETLSKDENI
ncbi:MAG: response regulator [Aquificae bacterium]|nr:response regulator [Aquificota bacterium]